MKSEGDIQLTCRSCGREFTFTTAEQEFYEQKDFKLPSRCKECRHVKEKPGMFTCAACGNEIDREETVYCPACYQLTFEQITRESQKLVDEAQAKLIEAESYMSELAEAIKEKDKQIAELILKSKKLSKQSSTLGHQIKELSQELEEAHQIDAKLSWFQSTLTKVDRNLKDIINTQNTISQRMLDIVIAVKEGFERTSLWDMVKYRLNELIKQNTKPETR